MFLTQRELLGILSNLPIIQSDEWAMLFLRKKNELMLRNVLTIALEKYCRDNQLPSEILALHEFKNHDVAIVERSKPKKAYKFIPKTLIELKFTNVYWILLNELATDILSDDNHLQDNIWRENYQFRKPPGNETGIKYDLLKLIKKQKNSDSHVTIHHVLALVNPHHEIDKKYKSLVDEFTKKNEYIGKYKNHREIFNKAVEILKNQLKSIETSYLDKREFEILSTSLTIGTAYGTYVDLGFVVISEKTSQH